jgi:hypothetical protein
LVTDPVIKRRAGRKGKAAQIGVLLTELPAATAYLTERLVTVEDAVQV